MNIKTQFVFCVQSIAIVMDIRSGGLQCAHHVGSAEEVSEDVLNLALDFHEGNMGDVAMMFIKDVDGWEKIETESRGARVN